MCLNFGEIEAYSVNMKRTKGHAKTPTASAECCILQLQNLKPNVSFGTTLYSLIITCCKL